MSGYTDWELNRVIKEELPKISRSLQEIVKLLKENSDYRKAFGDPK